MKVTNQRLLSDYSITYFCLLAIWAVSELYRPKVVIWLLYNLLLSTNYMSSQRTFTDQIRLLSDTPLSFRGLLTIWAVSIPFKDQKLWSDCTIVVSTDFTIIFSLSTNFMSSQRTFTNQRLLSDYTIILTLSSNFLSSQRTVVIWLHHYLFFVFLLSEQSANLYRPMIFICLLNDLILYTNYLNRQHTFSAQSL